MNNVIAKLTVTCPKCCAQEIFYDVAFGMKAEHYCEAGSWKIQRRRNDDVAT